MLQLSDVLVQSCSVAVSCKIAHSYTFVFFFCFNHSACTLTREWQTGLCSVLQANPPPPPTVCELGRKVCNIFDQFVNWNQLTS